MGISKEMLSSPPLSLSLSYSWLTPLIITQSFRNSNFPRLRLLATHMHVPPNGPNYRRRRPTKSPATILSGPIPSHPLHSLLLPNSTHKITGLFAQSQGTNSHSHLSILSPHHYPPPPQPPYSSPAPAETPSPSPPSSASSSSSSYSSSLIPLRVPSAASLWLLLPRFLFFRILGR